MNDSNLKSKKGAALIVIMWILVIIAMIVSTFAFEMHLEARIISAQRKRFKAEQLALAGIEFSKAMLSFKEENPADEIIYEEEWLNKAAKIADGVSVVYSEAFGDGNITINIDYEESRRNVRTLSTDDWKMLFEQAGIPNTRWDAMLDCLEDWQDPNDLHQLNGAESDDPFYRQRAYPCKDAPIDMIDELLLVKNWGEEVLHGTPSDEKTGEPIRGIFDQLTTWGDGKINPNSATREVLNSMSISEDIIEAILELRLGIDGEAGTEDDGLTDEDLNALGLNPALFTLRPEYVCVTSIGQVGSIDYQISSIFKLGEKELTPLFWSEGKAPE